MKSFKRSRSIPTIAFLLLVLSSSLFAQEAPVAWPPAVSGEELRQRGLKPLSVEKVSPGVFRLGEINIYKESKSITFPATVNMDKGLLEYLLVRTSGKVHESLLRTDVDPYHLQIALLLLGFEGTDRPIPEQGASDIPKGEPVDITITYQTKDGKEITVKAEDWVTRKSGDELKDAGKIAWVYTGSVVRNGRLLAQQEGSIVAVYHDPVALIDSAAAGAESDKIWFSKEGTVLPAGTAVTVRISSLK